MALNFGNLFPSAPVFVNYDWVDLVARTGYVTYYLTYGSDYIWTTNEAIYSQLIKTYAKSGINAITTSYSEAISITADLEFNSAQNLKGDLYLNVPTGAKPDDTDDVCHKVEVGIYHYDGTTATIIGSLVDSGEMQDDGVAGGAATANTAMIKLPIASTVHFKANEILRVIIKLYVRVTGGTATVESAIGHDPMNQTDRDQGFGTSNGAIIPEGRPTKLTMFVPFKLDVDR